jgi:hypothetical protein
VKKICHPGEGPGEQDDEERAKADVMDAPEQCAELERRRDHRGNGLSQEAAEATERLDDLDDPPAEAFERPQSRRDGRLSHACARRYTPRAQSGK